MQNNLSIITLNEPDITDFAGARNKLLAQAKTDWVLFLDSDETVSPALRDEINQAIKSNLYDAYYIKRIDTFLGRKLLHGEPGHAKFIRLARKSFGSWQRPVHEIWVRRGGLSSTRIGTLTSPLMHTPHTSISSFLDKINLYSQLDAEYRRSLGKRSSLIQVALYPPLKFIYNYIFLLGILDGAPGMIMALMMSFHSYLTWTKLYLLWRKN